MRSTIKIAAKDAIDRLSSIYEDREAQNIINILFKDLFSISNLLLERVFEYESELEEAMERLLANEPIQYVTGIADFYGLKFRVNHHVLIPRPETEELVHWVLRDNKNSNRILDILDIGLGSGCIALTIKKKAPRHRLFGIDYNMDTLNVARINSRLLRTPITFYNMDFLDEDLWSALGRFDLIVSNPPYIPESDRKIMADNVLLYEPEKALFAKAEGLEFYKKIKQFAEMKLNHQGFIYLEIHEEKANEIGHLFDNHHWEKEIRKDHQGKERMMKLKKL